MANVYWIERANKPHNPSSCNYISCDLYRSTSNSWITAQEIRKVERFIAWLILILIFGFKFGYDLFFSKIIPSINITNISIPDFNNFTQFIINASTQYPIIYGLASVSIAILIGVLIAYSFRKIV